MSVIFKPNKKNKSPLGFTFVGLRIAKFRLCEKIKNEYEIERRKNIWLQVDRLVFNST